MTKKFDQETSSQLTRIICRIASARAIVDLIPESVENKAYSGDKHEVINHLHQLIDAVRDVLTLAHQDAELIENKL